MSQDPGVCGNCEEEKVRAKYQQPRISWENVTASTSGSLGGKLKLIKNAADPFEYDDKSHCSNINCDDGQENIVRELRDINEDLKHAARTGDWTKIDEKNLERLEQLSGKTNEVVDVADIDWLDNDTTGGWNEIQDEIDELENNRNDAIVRTAEVESQSDARIHGKEKINECDSSLDNLDELRHSIYLQELVVDHVDRITDRSNEQEVVADTETTIRENAEDEQQERDDVYQEHEEENKEALKERIKELEAENEDLEEKNEDLTAKLDDRDETIENLEEKNEELLDDKKDLIDELQDLTDDKIKSLNERQELNEENLKLKEEILNLKSKTQHREAERGSEAGKADTTEQERDENEAATTTAVTNGEASNGATSSTGKPEPDGESKQTTESSGRTSGFDPNRTLSQEEIRELELNSDWSQYNQPSGTNYTSDPDQANEPDEPTREEQNEKKKDREPGSLV